MAGFPDFVRSLFPIGRFRATAKRFPHSTLCAVAGFLLVILMIHEWIKEDDEFFGRLFTILSCGYFWFGITKLVAESRSLKLAHYYALAYIPLILFGSYVFLSEQYEYTLFFLMPALLLLITVAPFTKGGDDISVWTFNYTTWFGVGMSIIASLILGGGLSAALASIDYLFGVDVDEKIYGDIWALACLIVAPLYALSWVPERFIFSAEECRAPTQLNFIINWLLAPLVWIYMLILYAYLIKIMVTMEVPRGQLAYMISGFGGVGVITYLVGWPLREEGSPLLRGIYRYFFLVLIVPMGMMFYAVGERISLYGITEQRYALVLAALWFASLSILFVLRKFPLKVITGLLAVLFLLASFGPWSGVSVSGRSQTSRLEKLLVKYEILKDGKIEKTAQEIPFEDRQNISSILDYLQRTERVIKVVKPWVKDADDKWSYPGTHEMVKRMGFEYVSGYEIPTRDDQFNFYVSRPEDIIDVRGFDYVWLNQYINTSPGSWERASEGDAASGRPKVKMSLQGDMLEIGLENAEPLKIDLHAYAEEAIQKYRNTQPPEMGLERENASIKARLDIRSMHGEINNGKPKLQSMQFSLFLDVKDQ